VGGVSEGPTRATEEQSSALPEGRNSGRHLGSPDVGRLRGLPKKREPRPVRHVCSGARSHAVIRTGDKRCPLEQRGGERRQRAPGARTHRGRRLTSASMNEDTSFAHSRDPCTSIATEPLERKLRRVVRSVRYRGRANLRKREEPAPGSERTDGARLAACHRCSRLRKPTDEQVVRDASEKEGGHGHRPCEETRAPERCPYVVFVAEVGRQHPGLE